MSYSISTLLIRNLEDVFGENDPARRRAAIDEIFTEDCAFYEPRGVYRGRDEIHRVAGAIKATHPDFRYQPIAGPEEVGNGGGEPRGSGRPREARSRRLSLPCESSQLPGPRKWAMAGRSKGDRAALVGRQLTPGLISTL